MADIIMHLVQWAFIGGMALVGIKGALETFFGG